MADRKKTLRALQLVTSELRVVELDFPATYFATLIFVALHIEKRGENPSLSDIADGTGLSRPAMSRIVQSMGNRRMGRTQVHEERPANSRPSLGLLERLPDTFDLRVIRAGLTPKGKALLDRIASHIESLED